MKTNSRDRLRLNQPKRNQSRLRLFFTGFSAEIAENFFYTPRKRRRKFSNTLWIRYSISRGNRRTTTNFSARSKIVSVRRRKSAFSKCVKTAYAGLKMIMHTVTGITVIVGVIALAIYMIITSTQKIKDRNEPIENQIS